MTELPNCTACGRSPWVHNMGSRNGTPRLSCEHMGDAFPQWVTYEVLLAIGARIPDRWKRNPPVKDPIA